MPSKYVFAFKETPVETIAEGWRNGGILCDDALLLILSKLDPAPVKAAEVDPILALLYQVPGPRGRPTGRLTARSLVKRLEVWTGGTAERELVDELIGRLREPNKNLHRRRIHSVFHIPEKGPRRNKWIWWTHHYILAALSPSGDGALSGIPLANFMPPKRLPPKRLALVVLRNFMRDGLRLSPPTIPTLRNILSQYSGDFVKHSGDDSA